MEEEVLGLGTLLCVILLLGYAMFENGPIHRSRFTEKIYLGLIFAIFMGSILVASGSLSCFVDNEKSKDESCQTWEGAGLGIWKTIIIGIVFLAVLTEILPEPPQKYSGRTAQDSCARATAQAKQIVITLKGLVRAYRKAESKAVPGRKKFGPIGVILVCIETFTTSWSGLATVFRVIVLLMVLAVSAHLCQKAYRFCFVKPQVLKRIYEELRYATEVLQAEELEHVIMEVNTAQIVESASHQTLNVLFKEARQKLTTTSMVVLLDALMKRSPATMRWDGFDQRLAEELICSVEGLQLTHLKNLVDTTGNIHSLHRLIFKELHASHRDKILSHFKTEGDEVRQSWKRVPLKILSDVDDTLYCGGKFPAGCDSRYPRHALYPGVLSFFAALDNYSEEVMDLKLSLLDKGVLVSKGTLDLHDAAATLTPRSPSSGAGPSFPETQGIKKMTSVPEIEEPPERAVKFGDAPHQIQDGPETDDKHCDAAVPNESVSPEELAFTEDPEKQRFSNVSGQALRSSVDSAVSWSSEQDGHQSHLQTSYSMIVRPDGEAKAHVGPKKTTILRVLNACTLPQLTKRLVQSGARDMIVRLEPHHVNLVFLSARPHVFQDVAEEKSYKLFRDLAKQGRMHCEPQLLSGRLSVSLGAVIRYGCMKTKSWREVGELKALSFEEHVQLYPEYDYVFCGDNGQGDLFAAERMLQSPFKDKVRAAFINDVCPHDKHLSLHPPGTYEGKVDKKDVPRVFFSKTYVGSAAAAFTQKLLSKEELNSVMRHAVADLHELHALHPRWDFNDVVFQLNQELQQANQMIADADLQVKPVTLSQSRPELNTPLTLILKTASTASNQTGKFLRRTSSDFVEMSKSMKRRNSTGTIAEKRQSL